MKVEIAYTEYCLPDYFSGDSRPWVVISPTEKGYTSRELRKEILNEFKLGAIGGNDPAMHDYIDNEKDQLRAEKFFSRALPACLNRIKYRGTKGKIDADNLREYKKDDSMELPLLYFVFEIID